MKKIIFALFCLIFSSFISNNEKNTEINASKISILEDYRVTSYYKNYSGGVEKMTIKVRTSTVYGQETLNVVAYMNYNQWYDEVFPISVMKVSSYSYDEFEKQFSYYAYVSGKKCHFNL